MRTFLDGVRGALPLAAEQIDVLLRLVEARGRPVESFADLGCGNGILAGALLERYPRAAATLVDFSERMIDEARDHLACHAANCHFVVANLADPAWLGLVAAEAPFELVVSGYAIHHLADARKRQLYGEVFDLLKPGGLFANTEHVKSATTWGEQIFDELMIDSLCVYHSERGSDKTREQIAEEFVHRPDKAENILAPVEVQCEWLRSCGFRDVDCYFKLFELAIFGGRRTDRR